MPDTAVAPLLEIDGIRKSFGGHVALQPLSLTVQAGEFFAILGPSGCGKSTLLRLLAGLETADAGRIRLAGRDITSLPPYARPLNMMFQSYALFPHLSVAGNVAFGLKQERLPRAEIRQRVAQVLEQVQMSEHARRRPAQLSGGQCQRVALARALVKRPRVLLLDEPLAALDQQLRERTQRELRQIQQALGITFIVVTHDQQEAMAMADRIAVMKQGCIRQVDTPAQVYQRPNSRYVAEFIGDVNLLSGSVVGCETTAHGARLRVNCAALAAECFCDHVTPLALGTTVCIALRPEKIGLELAATAKTETTAGTVSAPNTWWGTIQSVTFQGSASLYQVAVNQQLFQVKSINSGAAASHPLAPGESVCLRWDPAAGVLIDDDDEVADDYG